MVHRVIISARPVSISRTVRHFAPLRTAPFGSLRSLGSSRPLAVRALRQLCALWQFAPFGSSRPSAVRAVGSSRPLAVRAPWQFAPLGSSRPLAVRARWQFCALWQFAPYGSLRPPAVCARWQFAPFRQRSRQNRNRTIDQLPITPSGKGENTTRDDCLG